MSGIFCYQTKFKEVPKAEMGNLDLPSMQNKFTDLFTTEKEASGLDRKSHGKDLCRKEKCTFKHGVWTLREWGALFSDTGNIYAPLHPDLIHFIFLV